MNNEFRICNICKAVNFKSLEKRLKELDSEATINIGCQNVCGIGRNRPFVIVNHKLVVAETEDELINKVKEQLK